MGRGIYKTDNDAVTINVTERADIYITLMQFICNIIICILTNYTSGLTVMLAYKSLQLLDSQ